MLLFTASGFAREKKCWKTSFHLVWPDLIIDMERAHVIRLRTIDLLNKESGMDGTYLNTLSQRIKRASGQFDSGLPGDDMWSTIFDITGVRAGSLRMPYNDKVAPSLLCSRTLCLLISLIPHRLYRLCRLVWYRGIQEGGKQGEREKREERRRDVWIVCAPLEVTSFEGRCKEIGVWDKSRETGDETGGDQTLHSMRHDWDPVWLW